ncbi:MAG TPA: L-aspartate oxidase [Pyrinomonadaceae bacterium]|jgi:L-aspartate oxidase|nr:L-aspartate oxidase [Pyrinomonadaceae bacterium]
MSLETDFIVIGSGIAGLRAAIELASTGARVTVLTKDRTSESNTEYAQGGIAVALSDEDEVSLHEDDTLNAGAGLCDARAVRLMVEDGRALIQELIEWGTEFDREGGRLVFTQEAAHSRRRILHAHGDSTGHEIVRALLARARAEREISFFAHAATESLIIGADGSCCGVRYLDPLVRAPRELYARGVLLATGGAGQVFLHTTNPQVATGDGMAMAYAAGAELSDMEFVQFHPTALNLEDAPRFLLSEAMRGEGGVLRNAQGERFMGRYHERAELAPRDIVSRSIVAEMDRTAKRTVYLDMTALDARFLVQRFPKIYETCMRYGLDLTEDQLPVSPAAHYCMGGVRTDLDGRSSLRGLYAAGEVACTGVHGANRLASNSLLEGLVFGARAGRAAALDFASVSKGHARAVAASPEDVLRGPIFGPDMKNAGEIALAVRKRVRRLMWERVGILRSRDSIGRALFEFEQISRAPLGRASRNFLNVATLIARSALWREESRGAHFRTDYPKRDDERWQVHSIIRKDTEIKSSTEIGERGTGERGWGSGKARTKNDSFPDP